MSDLGNCMCCVNLSKCVYGVNIKLCRKRMKRFTDRILNVTDVVSIQTE